MNVFILGLVFIFLRTSNRWHVAICLESLIWPCRSNPVITVRVNSAVLDVFARQARFSRYKPFLDLALKKKKTSFNCKYMPGPSVGIILINSAWQTFLKLTWEFLAKKAQVAWKNGKMLLVILFCYHIKQQNLIKSQSKIPLNCYSLASQLQNGLNVWDTPCQKPSQNVPQMKKSFNYKDFFALFPVRRCPSNQSWIRSLNSFNKNSWYRERGWNPAKSDKFIFGQFR